MFNDYANKATKKYENYNISINHNSSDANNFDLYNQHKAHQFGAGGKLVYKNKKGFGNQAGGSVVVKKGKRNKKRGKKKGGKYGGGGRGKGYSQPSGSAHGGDEVSGKVQTPFFHQSAAKGSSNAKNSWESDRYRGSRPLGSSHKKNQNHHNNRNQHQNHRQRDEFDDLFSDEEQQDAQKGCHLDYDYQNNLPSSSTTTGWGQGPSTGDDKIATTKFELYQKYKQFDQGIIDTILSASQGDIGVADFQLKEMCADAPNPKGSLKDPPPSHTSQKQPFSPFTNNYVNNSPPTNSQGYQSPQKGHLTPPMPTLQKQISGLSTNSGYSLDRHDLAEFAQLSLKKATSWNSGGSDIKHTADQEYLNQFAYEYEERQEGDDITKQDMMAIIDMVRKRVGEDGEIDENDYIATQYMNDMVLLQAFINKKVQSQVLADMDSKGKVSINSRKDFPTLGGGKAAKKPSGGGPGAGVNKKKGGFYGKVKAKKGKFGGKDRAGVGGARDGDQEKAKYQQMMNLNGAPDEDLKFVVTTKKRKKKGKKKGKGKRYNNFVEPMPKIETPFDKVKVKKEVVPQKEKNIIEELQKQKKEIEQKKIDEMKKHGPGGFTLEDTVQDNFNVIKKNGWNSFEKNYFFKGSAESQDIFLNLHNIFPRIMLSRLKMFFKELGENFNITKEFLLTEFPSYYKPNNVFISGQVRNPDFVQLKSAFNPKDTDEDFSIDVTHSRKLKAMNHTELMDQFHDLRTKIRNLQKIYYLCSLHSSKARSQSNHQRANSLVNERKRYGMDLDKLKEECIFIAFEMSRRSDFKRLDLHGLYLEEAEEVVMLVLNKIKQILHVKRRDDPVRRGHSVEIITGRGSHSRGGRAILFPKIKAYLESENYSVKVAKDNGKLTVNVKL